MKTIKQSGKGIYIEKKSEFIAYALRINDKEDAKKYIDDLKKEHKDAKHICYAYKTDRSSKAYDDGEPAKTAGAPIMKIIESKNLENVLVAVVRYFGGIKLGASNLSAAYAKGAAAALENAVVTDYDLSEIYLIETDLSSANKLISLSGRKNLKIIDTVYGERAEITIAFKTEDKDKIMEYLNGAKFTQIKYIKNDYIEYKEVKKK